MTEMKEKTLIDSLAQLDCSLEQVARELRRIAIGITVKGCSDDMFRELLVINTSGTMVRWRTGQVVELLKLIETIILIVPPTLGAAHPRPPHPAAS